jgi:hypothetical protein
MTCFFLFLFTSCHFIFLVYPYFIPFYVVLVLYLISFCAYVTLWILLFFFLVKFSFFLYLFDLNFFFSLTKDKLIYKYRKKKSFFAFNLMINTCLLLLRITLFSFVFFLFSLLFVLFYSLDGSVMIKKILSTNKTF